MAKPLKKFCELCHQKLEEEKARAGDTLCLRCMAVMLQAEIDIQEGVPIKVN